MSSSITRQVHCVFYSCLKFLIYSIIASLVTVFTSGSVGADDAEIVKLLKAKGAEFKESKGVITSLSVSDGSKLSDDDFRQIATLSSLKMITLSNCLNDKQLAQLTSLTSLEYLQTNLADLSDEGTKSLAQFKSLKILKFFHPGKSFWGSGLVYLAELPNLQSLT